MISIKELLNKIKYSPRENPEDYVLFYYDRIEDKLKELRFVDVERVEEGFLVLEKKVSLRSVQGKEVLPTTEEPSVRGVPPR